MRKWPRYLIVIGLGFIGENLPAASWPRKGDSPTSPGGTLTSSQAGMLRSFHDLTLRQLFMADPIMRPGYLEQESEAEFRIWFAAQHLRIKAFYDELWNQLYDRHDSSRMLATRRFERARDSKMDYAARGLRVTGEAVATPGITTAFVASSCIVQLGSDNMADQRHMLERHCFRRPGSTTDVLKLVSQELSRIFAQPLTTLSEAEVVEFATKIAKRIRHITKQRPPFDIHTPNPEVATELVTALLTAPSKQPVKPSLTKRLLHCIPAISNDHFYYSKYAVERTSTTEYQTLTPELVAALNLSSEPQTPRTPRSLRRWSISGLLTRRRSSSEAGSAAAAADLGYFSPTPPLELGSHITLISPVPHAEAAAHGSVTDGGSEESSSKYESSTDDVLDTRKENTFGFYGEFRIEPSS